MGLVSIITPAYNAKSFILRPVQSLINQSYKNWEMLIISDDQFDYKPILEKAGINDKRIRFLSTGKVASGASNARNIGIRSALGNIIALLDSDDFFAIEKLEMLVPIVNKYGLVSSGLKICNQENVALRSVGCSGESRIINTSEYKEINFSMDSMIVFDKKKFPVIYDTQFKFLEDLELMLKLFEYTDKLYHVVSPFHSYYKQSESISYSANSHFKYRESKNILLKRLEENHYKFLETATSNAMTNFLEKSILVESKFEEALKKNKEALFEDAFESLG